MDNRKQSKKFMDLLLRYSKETSDEDRKMIETELWKEYGTEQVVFGPGAT